MAFLSWKVEDALVASRTSVPLRDADCIPYRCASGDRHPIHRAPERRIRSKAHWLTIEIRPQGPAHSVMVAHGVAALPVRRMFARLDEAA